MREFIKILESQENDKTIIEVECNCAERLMQLLEFIKSQSAIGTGITITAEDNGGNKIEIYIDGDGPDRIYSVKER